MDSRLFIFPAISTEGAVHIVVMGLYSFTLWLAALAWVVITGGNWLAFLALSPLIISGLILAILMTELAWIAGRWLWRNRGTLRRWRPPPDPPNKPASDAGIFSPDP